MARIASYLALNRFGLGAAPGEADAIDSDPRGWLLEQIPAYVIRPKAFEPFADSRSIFEAIHTARKSGGMTRRDTMRALYRREFAKGVLARAREMVGSPTPFAERMVMFWSNHFTVSRSRGIIGPAIPAYEREAIRPHIFGRFEDMLKAVNTHVAMLTYLDNVGSMGEGSRVGKRRLRRLGGETTLNENLAREILELHTLGVNGGYSQADVIELAKAISGWSHGGLRRGRDTRPIHGGFEFRSAFHEPGPKTVLGKRYAEAASAQGPAQGLAVLSDLARHPSTARFIATKLVRHFVADDPPPAAVEALAAVYRSSDGDLAQVSRALIQLEAAWTPRLVKVKSPYELVISTHRAVGATHVRTADIVKPLREFGHEPFAAPTPQGWGDTAGHWVSPEAIMRRLEWLRGFAATVGANHYPENILRDALGPLASDATRTWVRRAPSGDAAIAMVLASPEFQRR